MMLVTLLAPCLQNFIWWLCLVPWNFGEEKVYWKNIKGKSIQKSLQRNRQIQSWAKLIGISELPNEVERVQVKLSNVPSVFGVSIYWCFCGYCRVWISCTRASAVAVGTVGSGCLFAVLLQRKNCSRRACLGMGLSGMFIVFFHPAICNLYFNINPLDSCFSFACKCLISMWYSQ